MKYKNEHQRQMAILEAALPYVAPGSRYGIQLLLKADSFARLARQEPDSADGDYPLEAAEAGSESATFHPDLQGLLLHIQEFLTPRESDMVQTVLNFMNAGKLLQNYNSFMRSHAPFAEKDSDSEDGTPDLNAASAAPYQSNNPMQMLFQLINGLGALGNGFAATPRQEQQSSQNNLLKEFLMSQLNPEQKATFEQLQNMMYNESVS